MFAPLSKAEKAALRATPTASITQQLADILRAHKTRILDLFRHLDGDYSGHITKLELTEKLQALDVNTSGIDELFSQLDPDGSGTIEFRELQRAILAVTSPVSSQRGSRSASPTPRSSSPTPRDSSKGGGRPQSAHPHAAAAASLPHGLQRTATFERRAAAAKLIDGGCTTTLRSCLDRVRRVAIDAEVPLSPREILQCASGVSPRATLACAPAPAAG